jgi:alpha-glucosidase
MPPKQKSLDPKQQLHWWQREAIYQVYPRSFQDSTGDGVGDLEGIRRRLDHIASLGATAIWLSPIFPSPMADNGYDIKDYHDIDPTFGTLDDFDKLLSDAHDRGIKIILDYVANHTSNEHPWFLESRASRDNPKRNWYVWADPSADGGPPNDWQSTFKAAGPAWTFDELTDQYYLHSFLAEQPDLNWDNPEVEAAMHDIVRFWLGRGVDGLRLDAIIKIAKDPELGNNKGAPHRRHEDWDSIHDRLARLRNVFDEYPDRMMVGELDAKDLPRFATFLSGTGMNLAHNFEFINLPWNADAYRSFIDRFEQETAEYPGAWPCWFVENHDHPRAASRFGKDHARALYLITHMLRGTPFIYQGQELGLPDAHIPLHRIVDIDGRDPGRAPMPWQRPSHVGEGAGFTTGEPWLPVVQNAETLCAEAQEQDQDSFLHFARTVGWLRRKAPELQNGSQRMLTTGKDVLAWVRKSEHEQYLVLVNFANSPTIPELPPEVIATDSYILISTQNHDPHTLPRTLQSLTLAPNEAIVVQL